MNDRWTFSTKEVEGSYKLIADPKIEQMSAYIAKATRELINRVTNAEEQMLLEATPTPTLEILHKRIGRILESRKNGSESKPTNG